MSELYRPKEVALLEAADTAVDDKIENEIRPDIGQVGDVVQSMLTEAQFQALRGVGWVLMDGRNVSGSQYQTITGNSTLPDARGVFLRGKNNGRSTGSGNVAGELNLGTGQSDSMQGHRHAVFGGYRGKSDGGTNPTLYDDANATYLDTTLGSIEARELRNDGTNGNPRVSSETRPRNITVNTFIKIN